MIKLVDKTLGQLAGKVSAALDGRETEGRREGGRNKETRVVTRVSGMCSHVAIDLHG